MHKIFFLVLSLFLGLAQALAQTDSVVFVTAPWSKEKIKPGIWWKHCAFTDNLFASNQYINILEVKNKGRRKLDLGFEKQELKTASDFGKAAQAIAALNGTFFDVKNGGSVDFLKVDGQVINENRLNKNGDRAEHQTAAVVIRKGKLDIKKWDGTPDWEKSLEGEDIMVTGPPLVSGSVPEKRDSTAFAKTRHPRTAIAVTKDRVLLIAIDGRDKQHAAGMSLFELTRIMRWLGAVDALNLDGGGSTTLWIYNQPENGVVNFPSDNKVWDHAGERKVANVVLVNP